MAFDPRAVPTATISWPSAYRLVPARVPANDDLARYGEGASYIADLIAMTDPLVRSDKGHVPLDLPLAHTFPSAVRSAFANPLPEWRYMPAGVPHMWAGERLKTAIHISSEIYGAFLHDTNEGQCTLNMVVDRMVVNGAFADLSDKELFAKLYAGDDFAPMHQAVLACTDGAEKAGVLINSGVNTGAIITDPSAISSIQTERAIAMEWDGTRFTRYFDYRDLYWADLA